MYKTALFLLLSFAATEAQAACDTHAAKLVKSYPQIKGCQNNKIIFVDGSTMRYDDGTKERFGKVLKHADIEDMFHHSYTGGKYSHPPKNYDPGRYRNDAFFRKIYGSSATAVKKHLTTIDWFGQKVRVTTVNHVDRHLQAVERDLKKLLKKHPGSVP